MENTLNYKITNALTDAQIIELVAISKIDPILAKWTSDPERFGSEEVTRAWIQSNSNYIVLTNADKELLGIAWIQEKQIPAGTVTELTPEKLKTYSKTSGIRLYGNARGKGLGTWFYLQLLQRYESPYVWAQISDDNLASKRLHEKLSFKQVSSPDSNNKIILVRDSFNN